MRVSPFVVLALFSAAAASAAQKREEPGYQPPPPTIVATPLALAIAAFDRDGDLVVGRAEFEAGMLRAFAAADSDKDGKVSLIELANWSEVTLGSRGALPGQFDFDKDGDDSISRDEFLGLLNTRFATLDVDRDGGLRRSELVSMAPTPTRPGRREGREFRGPPPR